MWAVRVCVGCWQGAKSSPLPMYCILFSCGYFAYDTWDMLQVRAGIDALHAK